MVDKQSFKIYTDFMCWKSTLIKLVSHKVQLNKIIQKVRLCWEGSNH
jgi:hypothetical protein